MHCVARRGLWLVGRGQGIWVGRVETGSLIERGQDTPENAVATNMIGAVSPMARASPIRRPVTTPCKL